MGAGARLWAAAIAALLVFGGSVSWASTMPESQRTLVTSGSEYRHRLPVSRVSQSIDPADFRLSSLSRASFIDLLTAETAFVPYTFVSPLETASSVQAGPEPGDEGGKWEKIMAGAALIGFVFGRRAGLF